MDSEGKRVAVKYYTDEWPTNSAKLAFEKSVFSKTQKTNARAEGKFFKFSQFMDRKIKILLCFEFLKGFMLFICSGNNHVREPHYCI